MPKVVKVGDSAKVRGAIRNFLEKMKACDTQIPEELADDALEMAEEVKDALECEVEDEEADVLEVTKDEDPDVDLEAKVADAVGKALMKCGLVKDRATRSLDELEEELKEKDEDPDEENTLDECNEEEVTVDPETIKDSGAAMRKFIREIKPQIAKISDSRTRKSISDSVVKFARMNMSDNGQYAAIMNTAKKNASNVMNQKNVSTTDADIDFGMNIAAKWNPHYKQEG